MTIELKDSRIAFFIFLGIGVACLVLAILKKTGTINPPAPYFHLFLSFGIAFAAAPFLFLFRNERPARIEIDPSTASVFFYEGGERYGLPFEDFSDVRVVTAVHQSGSGSGSSQSVSYMLVLNKKTGAELSLKRSEDKSALLEDAEKIGGLMGLNVYAGPELSAIARSTDTDHAAGGGIEAEKPALRDLEKLTLGRRSPLTIKEEDGGLRIIWHNYRSIVQVLILGAVIAAFNLLIFKFAFPMSYSFTQKAGMWVSAVLLIVINLVFVSILLFNFFGRQELRISNTAVSLSRYFFGGRYYEKSLPRGEIAGIHADFDGSSNALTLYGKNASRVLADLREQAQSGAFKEKSGPAMGIFMFEKIGILSADSLLIESSALSVRDKLYIEGEIFSGIRD